MVVGRMAEVGLGSNLWLAGRCVGIPVKQLRFKHESGAAMSSSPCNALLNGDEDVTTPLQFGEQKAPVSVRKPGLAKAA
jgi:hypothetical protein